MRDTQLELIGDGGDPGVVLCFKHLLWSSQIQITCRQTDICTSSRGQVQVSRGQRREDQHRVRQEDKTF